MSLPSEGFFEVRFESIGGLGAHAAGQVLATAAVVRMGLNGAHFSSYGSEKKGSLVRSFVRLGAAGRPIRTSAPVEAPGRRSWSSMPRCCATRRRSRGLKARRHPDLQRAGGRRARRTRRAAARPRASSASTPLGIAVQEKSRPNAVLLGTLCGAVPVPRRRPACSRRLPRSSPASTRKPSRPTSARSGAARPSSSSSRASAAPRATCPIARPSRSGATRRSRVGGILPAPGNTRRGTTSPRRASGWMPVLDHDQVHPLRRVRPGLPRLLPGLGRRRRRRQVRARAEGHRLPLLQGLPALRRVLPHRRARQDSARRRASPTSCACRSFPI